MTGLPALRLFRRKNSRRRRRENQNPTPIKIAKPVALPSKTPELKTRIRKLNTLGRLEARTLSRSVPDKRFGESNIYYKKKQSQIILNKNLDAQKKFIDNSKINLRFLRNSEICKARKNRRDEIMRKTKGKGMKVKNALWNVASFIQCPK